MSELKLNDITKTFPEPTGKGNFTVLDNISLEANDQSFTSIMGPSGCGKSTILNIIAGITPPGSGTITLDGQNVTPGDFSFGYVFQEPRLLNWRTVEQNLKLVMRANDIPEDEQDTRIKQWLQKVGLDGEQDNYPLRLSGGMRQRVGLCRAMVLDPDILLMDEPFSALDEVTARKLRRDLLDLWEEQQKEILFVTHDIGEAVYLSDRILFMNEEGQIFKRVEVDIPRPRQFEDPRLQEMESELTKDFFSQLE